MATKWELGRYMDDNIYSKVQLQTKELLELVILGPGTIKILPDIWHSALAGKHISDLRRSKDRLQLLFVN